MNPGWKTAILLLPLLLALPSPIAAAGVDRGKMRVEFLYSIEYAGGRSERLRAPQDIFFDRQSGELYIADAGSRQILIYNDDGAFLQGIRVEGKEGSPTMVATDRTGRIYVGYNNSARIGVLSYKGDPLESLELPGVVDVPGAAVRPLYLAASREGQVFALKSAGGIVEIDPDGGHHKEIGIAGEGAPNVIYGMAVGPEGRFFFGDMRPYSVVAYDPKEKEFHRFGSPGILYGQLARPMGMAADDAGHLFVTSLVRNKVLCYDRKGNFLEEFGGIGRELGRFYMPTKVVSDGNDRLFVLEEALKRVQVFRVKFQQEKEVVQGAKAISMNVN